MTVPYGEMLVNLRKEKRTRKTRLTKLKHRLQKLFKTRAEREEIESCIEEIWEILEEAQAVMDDMSVLALKMNNSQLQAEIMKESDSLQEETQKLIEKAAGLSLKYRVGGCIKKVDGYRYIRMWDKITRAIGRTSWSKLKLPCKRFETSLVSCTFA